MNSESYKRNQAVFKARLFLESQECCFSGERLKELIQAAHIVPVSKNGTDSPSNGILLTADLHILFDKGLIWVDPRSGRIHSDSSVKKYLSNLDIRKNVGKKAISLLKKAFQWRKDYPI